MRRLFKAPGGNSTGSVQPEVHGGLPNKADAAPAQCVEPEPSLLNPSDCQPEDAFAILVEKLKCIKVYDHVPKPCRDTVANILSSLLNELCEDPYNLDHWIRLACFFRLFS